MIVISLRGNKNSIRVDTRDDTVTISNNITPHPVDKPSSQSTYTDNISALNDLWKKTEPGEQRPTGFVIGDTSTAREPIRDQSHDDYIAELAKAKALNVLWAEQYNDLQKQMNFLTEELSNLKNEHDETVSMLINSEETARELRFKLASSRDNRGRYEPFPSRYI